ncbi:MAG: hypothetical protein HYX55_11305 [Chloroflexi bacterium]|nr:hypothetical protein [Chloroflexota bacterium]
MSRSTPSLGALVKELAAQLPEVVGSAGPGAPGAARPAGATTLSFRGKPFAVLSPTGIELRLDPPIAAAATRTPDTAPSPRGKEWVRFSPRELDGHAVDRLEAWFELAYRRAGA